MQSHQPSYARERAAFWRVDLRTMQRWLARVPPVPVATVEAMLAWYAGVPSATQAKFAHAFRRRISELRVERERAAVRSSVEPPAPPPSSAAPASPHAALGPPAAPASPITPDLPSDPYYAEFLRAHPDDAAAPTDADRLAGLRQALAFANFKLLRSQARGDHAARKDATEEIRHLSAVIRADELAAQRLNRELGDTLPRADAERLARALSYWLLRSVDHLHALIDRPLALASQSGPLYPEEVRARLDPALLETLVSGPLLRAASVPALAALPRWFIEALRAGQAAALEDGARLFDELYPMPPPQKPICATEAPSAPPPAPTAAPSALSSEPAKSADKPSSSDEHKTE